MLVWLENAYSRPFLGSFLGQMMSLIVLTPKRTILGPNHVIWAINRENRSRRSSWACVREKKDRTGHDRKKKSQKCYISSICGEAPTEAMYMKICVVGDVFDVITCAKFQNEIFRGYNFTGGRIFHFSYFSCLWLQIGERYAEHNIGQILANVNCVTFAICYRHFVCRLSVCRL